MAPAVGDLDGDGRLEFVWGTTGGDATAYAFNDDGTLLPGWPITVPSFTFLSQATLGDIDGDGEIEALMGGFRVAYPGGGRLYAWNADGSLVPGFPFSLPDGGLIIGSSATITDLDLDGDVELLVGTSTGFGTGLVSAFDLTAPYNPTLMEWPTLWHDVRHTGRYEPPPEVLAVVRTAVRVECTSPLGAPVVLDGSGSASRHSTTGTNLGIVAFEWFENFGTPAEQLLGAGPVLTLSLGLGPHRITLRVTDTLGRQDVDEATVSVVDRTPPDFDASLHPAVLWPPNHRMVELEVQAIATDLCGSPSFVLESVTSSEADDAVGMGDGSTVGDIQGTDLGSDDLSFELRAERDGRGDGRVYTVIYEATDASGNTATQLFEVVVPHDLGGSTEPLMLRASQGQTGTVLAWDEFPGAWSYDLVRGELANLRELNGSYRLGPLTCLAAGATETSTVGLEDPGVPPVGQGFFYLAGYDDGRHSGYGTESAAKERFVPPGQEGCQ
jgi:hypothetical protein